MDLQDLLRRAQGRTLRSEQDDLSEDLVASPHVSSPEEVNTDDNLALDDAENPLQLLARASDLQLSPGVQDAQKAMPFPPNPVMNAENRPVDEMGAKSFFVPVRASRDVGPEIDPIDMGLVTPEEADSLFALYVSRCSVAAVGLMNVQFLSEPRTHSMGS